MEGWPETGGRRVVFLLDATGRLEQRLLADWIDRHRPAGVNGEVAIPIPSSRRRRRSRLDPRLEATLATDDDPLLAPLRVAWFARGNPTRTARLRDLVTFGDGRDPGTLRQAWALRRRPESCRIVVGTPAPASDLRRRWQQAGGSDVAQTTGLADFVARQATLALERAERRLRGSRYKVPRFVYEDILGRPAFRGGVARIAAALGKPEHAQQQQAARYLREIAATHSPFVIDLTARLIHQLVARGYSAVRYDRQQLEHLFALGQRHPLVFLPTHKSNLDHLVLQYVLHENGHPPNHTAGGINMNFFPVGPLVRRSGVFFIRRTFKDNPLYKFVLQQYIDYLIEKRFTLEWYLEGGRSRSGKLLPPRFGLFATVVDAYRRRRADDVQLIPVAIVYDQIQDVGDYVAEQRGGAKERESLGWFLRLIRRLHRDYGEIHVRFGEPLALSKALGPASHLDEESADERHLDVQKVAFESAVRINRVTPITPTSLVALTLLGLGDRAATVPELVKGLFNLVNYIRRRQLPTTVELDVDTPEGVQRILDQLEQSGVVSRFAEGLDAVYAIGPEQHLTAAYYRNTIIHFFVTPSIAELALLRAAEVEPPAAPGAFWDEALRLRDLLKFEFFFADREAFRAELRDEVALHDPDWEAALPLGGEAIRATVRRFKPFSAHRVLRPFLEAYRVVGDALERHDAEKPVDEAAFLSTCLALGKQYRLQRRIRREESVSKVLFATALRLARNYALLAPDGPELADRRRAFARDMRAVIRRIDAIDTLAASRVAGLIE
ncbi:glycerol-3-phosphate 1-O-acyltransferase [bacterium]|nr:glycerol-3-phosphate 1-O-acyltransferase [bacterium]